jgi:hypothetical protein
MLPLEMEQVCQEKKTVTVEAVKLAWEQAKGKVEVWAKAAAQMEKENVHLTQDEERAEQAPLMAERHGDDKNDSRSRIRIALFLSIVTTSVLAWIFACIDLARMDSWDNDNSEDPVYNPVHILLAIRFTLLSPHVIFGLLIEWSLSCYSGPPVTLTTYCGRPLHRDNVSSILSIFTIPIFACSLIITVVLQSRYKESGREWSFIAIIVNLSLCLTMYLIRPVYVMIDDYNRTQSSRIKALAQTKMATAVDAAVALTRDWATTKSADLQKLLAANNTSQIDLKRVLNTASNIENVIQTCENVQKMCQATVNNEDPSVAAKQTTEILQAIATVEGSLLEVEQMLPQPHHPDIQIA